jgi:diguanylate cyclase (GGDEF)-like protein
MFLDLDRFKDVNDTMGHDVGDELLSLMAQRIAACLREVDTVARLGGDEFTILLSDFDNRLEAVQVAQKLIKAIEKPLKINQKTIRASTSIGVTFYPYDGADSGLLVQNADRAMYAAKEMGGSTYAFYSSELELSWNSRKFILDELEHALDHGHLKVFYQPIMAASGGIVAAEALVRWQHPERGLISPGDFLPVAERMVFIDKLDDYVFTEVCFLYIIFSRCKNKCIYKGRRRI